MNFIVNVIALKSYYLIPSLSFTSRNLIVIKKGKLIGVAILYCIDYDIVQLLNLFSQSLKFSRRIAVCCIRRKEACTQKLFIEVE